jgi:hypothetical protein
MAMRKAIAVSFAAAVAAAMLIPHAVGSEADKVVLKQAGVSQTFADHLPEITVKVPWLNLDRRTKLPQGDYPLGREAKAVPFILQSSNIQHAYLVKFALGGP